MHTTRSDRKRRGAALVEFAIAVPLLMVIVWGVIDFARAYFTSNSLSAAVREGARFAAVRTDPAGSESQIEAKVMQTFNSFGGPALTAAQIAVYDSSQINGSVTVAVVGYDWIAVTPLTIFTGGKITMNRRATFRWEREPTI